MSRGYRVSQAEVSHPLGPSTRATQAQERKQRQDWRHDALCGTRPELPWAAEEPPTGRDWRTMRNLCRSCPVRADCAAFAVEQEVTWGFWAGRWIGSHRTILLWRYGALGPHGWAA